MTHNNHKTPKTAQNREQHQKGAKGESTSPLQGKYANRHNSRQHSKGITDYSSASIIIHPRAASYIILLFIRRVRLTLHAHTRTHNPALYQSIA